MRGIFMDRMTLLQEQLPRLRRYAWVLTKDKDAADDLCQDALVRAIDNIDRWQDGTNMRAWLFTIMHRLFLNSTRRQRMVSVEDLAPSQAVQPVLSRQEDAVHLAEVEKAFRTLSHDHRQVLHLVAVERLRYEEAAEVLGVAIGTIRSRLFRAREALEKALQSSNAVGLARDRGLAPTPEPRPQSRGFRA